MAEDITGLLVRRTRGAVLDTIAESESIDFDIPIGLAIRIWKVHVWLELADHDAAAITMEALLDLDGNALASNGINTQALFEAREVLASAIVYHGIKTDMITTGASLMSDHKTFDFQPEGLLTARNPGVAWLSLGASGEGKITLEYKWARISTAEFGQLIASRRA